MTKHDDGTNEIDYTYDNWSRIVTKAQDTTYEATYDYRYGGKLYDVTSDFPGEGNVTYDYGDDDQRKSRTSGGTTTDYYYDGWNVINEKTGSTWTTHTFDKRGPVGNILSQVDGDPATGAYEYFAHDNLGSTRALYDQSKNEAASYEYTPYGENYASSNTSTTFYRFTGKNWDSTSDLYHFAHRYYAPDAAGWTARDPIGMSGGLNMFGYVRGNPTNAIDPLGLCECSQSDCKEIAWDIYNDCVNDALDTFNDVVKTITDVYDAAVRDIEAREATCKRLCNREFKNPVAVRLCRAGCSSIASAAKKIALVAYLENYAMAGNALLLAGNQCTATLMLQLDECNNCLNP